MFWKLIFFHGEIAQYKEVLLTKSENVKIFKEENEKENKLVKD